MAAPASAPSVHASDGSHVCRAPPRQSNTPLSDGDLDDGDQKGADRLWSMDSRTIRVATCWKRWDVPEAPCQVPRERTLFYDLQVADATQSSGQNVAERHAEDCQTLGQFLQTNCFNLSRQCKNPKCREGVLRHEQCFSHHGGRFSLRVQQLPPDHGLPQEGVYTWSVAGGTTSPVHALSA